MSRNGKGIFLLCLGTFLLVVAFIALAQTMSAPDHQREGIIILSVVAGFAFFINTILGYWCLFTRGKD